MPYLTLSGDPYDYEQDEKIAQEMLQQNMSAQQEPQLKDQMPAQPSQGLQPIAPAAPAAPMSSPSPAPLSESRVPAGNVSVGGSNLGATSEQISRTYPMPGNQSRVVTASLSPVRSVVKMSSAVRTDKGLSLSEVTMSSSNYFRSRRSMFKLAMTEDYEDFYEEEPIYVENELPNFYPGEAAMQQYMLADPYASAGPQYIEVPSQPMAQEPQRGVSLYEALQQTEPQVQAQPELKMEEMAPPANELAMQYATPSQAYDRYESMYAEPASQPSAYQEIPAPPQMSEEQQMYQQQLKAYNQSLAEITNYLTSMGYSAEEAAQAAPQLLSQVSVSQPEAPEKVAGLNPIKAILKRYTTAGRAGGDRKSLIEGLEKHLGTESEMLAKAQDDFYKSYKGLQTPTRGGLDLKNAENILRENLEEQRKLEKLLNVTSMSGQQRTAIDKQIRNLQDASMGSALSAAATARSEAQLKGVEDIARAAYQQKVVDPVGKTLETAAQQAQAARRGDAGVAAATAVLSALPITVGNRYFSDKGPLDSMSESAHDFLVDGPSSDSILSRTGSALSGIGRAAADNPLTTAALLGTAAGAYYKGPELLEAIKKQLKN